MRRALRCLLLALSVAALVILVPLASATAIDPLWIPGIYDAADQDDVVGILVDDGLVGPPQGRVIDGSVPTAERIGIPLGTLATDNRCVDTLRLRSPPDL